MNSFKRHFLSLLKNYWDLPWWPPSWTEVSNNCRDVEMGVFVSVWTKKEAIVETWQIVFSTVISIKKNPFFREGILQKMKVKHKDHLSTENTFLSQQIYTLTNVLTCLQCLFTSFPSQSCGRCREVWIYCFYLLSCVLTSHYSVGSLCFVVDA